VKRVFIASPLAASPGLYTLEDNQGFARRCMLDSISLGESPYVPHILLTQILNDEVTVERELGILCALAWLEVSDVLAVYCDRGVSKGMRAEIGFMWDRAAREKLNSSTLIDFRYLDSRINTSTTLESLFPNK
jgi:hypothetical protein